MVRHIQASEIKREIVLVTIQGNGSLTGTFDGIRAGASRAFGEVMQVIEREGDSLSRISVCGHSLGGLYARYLVYLLEHEGVFDKLEPYAFITLASPHLGVRKPQTNLFNKFFQNVLLRVFQTTRELALLDAKGQSRPLLHEMGTSEEFLRPLKRFKRRVLYSNIRNDPQVHYGTSALRVKNPYKTVGAPDKPVPSLPIRLISSLVPVSRTASHKLSKTHLYLTAWSLDNMEHRKTYLTAKKLEKGLLEPPDHGSNSEDEAAQGKGVASAFSGDSVATMLHEMLVGLEFKVGGWERYDVSFRSLLAHSQIINKQGYLPGKSIVAHVVTTVLKVESEAPNMIGEDLLENHEQQSPTVGNSGSIGIDQVGVVAV